MNQIELQKISKVSQIPELSSFQAWVDAALMSKAYDSELTIRLVDEAESAELNERYRHKMGPTNILSFPLEAPPELANGYLGDLVICVPLVILQAKAQNKPVNHHWAHLVVHGVLHLLGYEHINLKDAERMEALEIKLLQHWQIPNPYLEMNSE